MALPQRGNRPGVEKALQLTKVILIHSVADDRKSFPSCLLQRKFAILAPDYHFRLGAKKGIRAMRSPPHGLQEKSVLKISGNGAESPDWCLQIGE